MTRPKGIGLGRYSWPAGFVTLCWASLAQVAPIVTLGSEACRQVHFPGDASATWSADPATTRRGAQRWTFDTDDITGLEFRARQVAPSILYFSAKPKGDLDIYYGAYSKEKYVINIDSAISPRRVSDNDWLRARKLVPFSSYSQEDYDIEDDDNKNISYNGRTFAKSGQHLIAAKISERRWIAVFSYDGEQVFVPKERRHSGNIAFSAPTKHPIQGRLHTDIYEVTTGRKIVAMGGAFENGHASDWSITAFFLEDGYFFFNTGKPMKGITQFLICSLPSFSQQ